jgi:hypothetical protein
MSKLQDRTKRRTTNLFAAGTDFVMLDSIEGSELASVAPRQRQRWTRGEGRSCSKRTVALLKIIFTRERVIAGTGATHTAALIEDP